MQKKALVLSLFVLVLAGCATSTSYVSYTYQRFPPKDPYYTENVYSPSQAIDASRPYYVIGRISVEGFASSGVTPGMLTNEAMVTARKRGADAIINAQTQIFHYYYSGDALLRFKGELVVYAAVPAK